MDPISDQTESACASQKGPLDMDGGYITVAQVDQVPPGTCRTVEVEGIALALCNVNGTFWAVDNACPHAGGPLGEGRVVGESVRCPWHGWRFNLRTGERPENPEIRVACVEVRVEDGNVQVKVPITL
ncbi:MAG: Naphthalene 1,2-dioxygenase/salicylate 5-hydroxylase systems, ferredoxin component [Nitrospirae bacterium]|nr:MAG: putative rieske-type ferredoxin [Nitrospira sp. OLB3]MBV6469253.1 Naphthalene 1,2-dioxygenase/salicylate 5-hydroxylase systems, ferredoxin component [Nitrospirota bacterium]MCK6492533.1 Rieske 2Fe-2S domain-containing protein [Nitrospira sp.]MCK6499145.1 Rieske 2Fe-2S domain-containing protein [Nitrospira sp.]